MAQKPKGTEDCYPCRLNHVVWKVIDGKGILLNLEDGAYFEVDPVGLSIWQRCNGKTTMEGIARAIAEDFQARPDRVASDLPSFVSELKKRKLLTLSNEPIEAAELPNRR